MDKSLKPIEVGLIFKIKPEHEAKSLQTVEFDTLRLGALNSVLCAVLLFGSILQGAYCLYGAGDNVVDLTQSNFESEVTKGSSAVYIVEFYAPWCGHCQALVPEWKKAAKALKGIVKVGAVNADEHKSLAGQYGIRGFPTIKIFVAGKSSPIDYNGGRTADAIVESAMSQLSQVAKSRLSGGGSSKSESHSGGDDSHAGFEAKDVEQLTDANFEKTVINSEDLWVVAFYAPWCGHCKRLAPEWAKAAKELKGKVRLGAVDATVQTVIGGRFQIQGYPTIKWFAAGKKDRSWTDAASDYDGGRTASDIVSWASEKAADSVPPPEVVQLTSQAELDNACQQHPLCVVSVLPVLYDCQSACRNKYLNTLREQAAKYKKQMWGWIWTEAGVYPDLEKALNLGGAGYPAMAVLSSKKMKYSLLVGPFSDRGISEFLRDVSFGQGSISSQSVFGNTLPSVGSTSKWDGRDMVIKEDKSASTASIDDEDLPELEPLDDPTIERRRQPTHRDDDEL